jgi:hypothetical protein
MGGRRGPGREPAPEPGGARPPARVVLPVLPPRAGAAAESRCCRREPVSPDTSGRGVVQGRPARPLGPPRGSGERSPRPRVPGPRAWRWGREPAESGQARLRGREPRSRGPARGNRRPLPGAASQRLGKNRRAAPIPASAAAEWRPKGMRTGWSDRSGAARVDFFSACQRMQGRPSDARPDGRGAVGPGRLRGPPAAGLSPPAAGRAARSGSPWVRGAG